MKLKENVKSYNSNQEITVTFDTPTVCPMCHTASDQVFISGYLIDIDNAHSILYVTLLCRRCKRPFIAAYGMTGSICTDIGTYPNVPEDINFQDSINDLSPKFVSIYNQAVAAESYGLNEISGIGYRKALEFLIKDYAIHIHPEKSDDIKKDFLSNVIKKYVDDEKIRTIAERATWIGNDETHYIRIFDGYDVDTMKEFIMAVVSMIHTNLVFEKATNICR
jgi:hypothetical protein